MNGRPALRLVPTPGNGLNLLAGQNPQILGSGTNSAVLSGRNNRVGEAAGLGAHESVIAGGEGNVIRADQHSSFIGGGARNEILMDNQHAVIVGGRDNRIGTNSLITSILGGAQNRILNNVDGGLIVGGFRNEILGSNNPNRRAIAPLIVGGSDNEIGRESSFAAIMAGDNNRIGTSSAGAYSWHRGGTHSNNSNDPGPGGIEMMRLNSGGLRVNGTFVSASDRALKDNLAPLNPQATLDRVLALPLYEWNYLADPGTRHAGPMAQDFKAAFGLGDDDRHIATVDAVALAAIQGLNRKLEDAVAEKDTELADLRAELADLRQLVAGLAGRPARQVP